MNASKVSIITPTYNGERFISETIDSVLSQNFSNWEMLIFDDGSTDNTKNIIQKYAKKDKRILYLSTPNVKQYTTGGRNFCIKNATGNYICLLDHDDVWLSTEKLSKQVEYLDSNTDIGICGTDYMIINELSQIIGEKITQKSDDLIRKNLLLFPPSIPCSIMLKRDLFVQYGLFDMDYDKADDYELWLRFGQYTKFYNIPGFLTGYRVHNTNTSLQFLNSLEMKKKDFLIFRKYFFKYPHSFKIMVTKIATYLLSYEFLLKHSKIINFIKHKFF